MREDVVELILEGIPIVWKAPYVGSRGAFSPKYNEKKIIQSILRSMYKGQIIKEPIRCDVFFYMPVPKSISKRKRIMMLQDEIRPTAGGDLVNLRKWIEDCLQEIVIENDRQIVEGETGKWYGEIPKTVIQILPI